MTRERKGNDTGTQSRPAPRGATRDKTYYWRGVAYPPDAPVPADFPTAEQLAVWKDAPEPFDLDSAFPPEPRPVPVAPPFVSEAGAPPPAALVDETWPAKARREQEAQARAAAEGELPPGVTEYLTQAQHQQAPASPPASPPSPED